MAPANLSPLGEFVRQHDPDRYFTALFAPAARRETLFTLYAFNHELARAREVVREPMMALIRLQWWREVLEGARRQHEVAAPLGAALDAGTLLASDLEPMIAAREMEAEPIDTLSDFDAYVHGAAGALMMAAARMLGMHQPEALSSWGAAVGIAGVLRNLPAFAHQGRCVLPLDLLAEYGLNAGQTLTDPDRIADAIRPRLANRAEDLLATRPNVPPAARAAALPAVFAGRDLKRRTAPPHRTLGDKLAVTWASVTGRLQSPRRDRFNVRTGQASGTLGNVSAMSGPTIHAVAPTGTLQVGVVQAPSAGVFFVAVENGIPRGVTVTLGTALADQLGLPVRFAVFPNSGECTEATATAAIDVAFMPVDALRQARVAFGPAYYLLESTYLVSAASGIHTLADVDRPGIRVVGIADTTTIRAAARTLAHTAPIPIRGVDEAIAMLRGGQADALALSRDSLNQVRGGIPGSRITPGGFQHTTVSIAVPPGRPDALAAVTLFLDDAKSRGIVRQALDAVGLPEEAVAP